MKQIIGKTKLTRSRSGMKTHKSIKKNLTLNQIFELIFIYPMLLPFKNCPMNAPISFAAF